MLQSFKIVLDELHGIMPCFFPGSLSLGIGKLFLGTNDSPQYAQKDWGGVGGVGGMEMLPRVHPCSSLGKPVAIAAGSAVCGTETCRWQGGQSKRLRDYKHPKRASYQPSCRKLEG